MTAVRKAKVYPLPYLCVCALIANAASFVLPISNPANLVVFHTRMPPLGRWLADFGVPSLLSTVATLSSYAFCSAKSLCKSIDCEVDDVELSVNDKLVLAGLALMIAGRTLALCMAGMTGLEPATSAVTVNRKTVTS